MRIAERTAVAVVLALSALACRSAAPPPEVPVLGAVTDVLAGEAPLPELVGGLPATLWVGPAERVDELLAARARALSEGEEEAALVDGSELDSRERLALEDRLVEAALSPGGPILIDPTGATAQALSAGSREILRVRLSAEGAIEGREVVRDETMRGEW